jgi:hypothetical protein
LNNGEEGVVSRSLPEAAYLYVLGARLSSISGTRTRSNFHFSEKDGYVRRLAHQYYNGGTVEAMTFAQAMSQLRREVDLALGTRALDEAK